MAPKRGIKNVYFYELLRIYPCGKKVDFEVLSVTSLLFVQGLTLDYVINPNDRHVVYLILYMFLI